MVSEFRVVKINRMLTPPNRRGPDIRWPSRSVKPVVSTRGENLNVHAGLSNV